MGKPGRKYLAMLQNKGKIKQVIEMAVKDVVKCSVCGHGARSHYPGIPGWETWSTVQLTKFCMSVVPNGSRKYCPGMLCKECKEVAVQ